MYIPGWNSGTKTKPVWQSTHLFWNTGAQSGPTYRLFPNEFVGALVEKLLGAAPYTPTLTGDGDLDVLLTQIDGPPRLFINQQQTGNHWLRVKLVGKSQNWEAIGAVINARMGNNSQVRDINPTRSYLASRAAHDVWVRRVTRHRRANRDVAGWLCDETQNR